jgi:ribosomal protein S12 methylthiotransferase accessory factor
MPVWYYQTMLIDGVSVSELQKDKNLPIGHSVRSFLAFLEEKIGVTILFNKRNYHDGRLDLAEQFTLAQKMIGAGLISSLFPAEKLPDEPKVKMWACRINSEKNKISGGISYTDDGDAIYAALAEALERYIWKEETDYYRKPLFASVFELQARGRLFFDPYVFVSYSTEQRISEPRLFFDENTKFTWIEGTDLLTKKPRYIPSQTVTGVKNYNHPVGMGISPLIRNRMTIGLATWPTLTGARLAGALECIERDAYMIMWLNQATLPRIDLASLAQKHRSIGDIIQNFERYKLKLHCIPMLTDAPTHTICTVVEDVSGHAPRFTIGLKAHRSITRAIEKSSLEALRARRSVRMSVQQDGELLEEFDKPTGHRDRLLYWAKEENARELEFLIRGELMSLQPKPWDNDSEEEHLKRILAWCKQENIDCVSISLTHSQKNLSTFFIEMVAMPQLQPTHLFDKDMTLGGERWRTVPQKFGFQHRSEMFSERPHPFV